MGIALVTGASSGLGREFVRKLSVDPAVKEIWAIARREDRLNQLRAISACPVRPIPLDLTNPASLDRLRALLEEKRPVISVLVCAAGIGKMGPTQEVSLEDTTAMIDLNCRSAAAVTHLCLPYLRRGSRVLEISSTSAFQPFACLNIYSATKAFLLHYAKALHYELRPKGIRVTAVCPYWLKDTEFIPLAKQGNLGDYRSYPFASRAKSVAALALAANQLGLWVSTPGIVCTLHRLVSKVIPDVILVPLGDLLRQLPDGKT